MDHSDFSIEGKRLLITGATSSIGKEVCRQLALAGAHLMLTGREEKKLISLHNELSGIGHVCIAADLVKEEEREMLAEKIEPLDGFVYLAGQMGIHPLKYITREKLLQFADINFHAPVLLVPMLFRKNKIKKGASFVFISSFAAQYPTPGSSLYSSSKAALEAFSKSIATEFGKKKIRSNVIAPAFIKSEILEESFKTLLFENTKKLKKEEVEKLYLLGFGEPRDVGNLIQFLVSDASKWITGQSIILDGGYHAGILSNLHQ